MVNTRFLTIYDDSKRDECETFSTTTTTKTANFRVNNNNINQTPKLTEELTENRKSFRATQNHVNFQEPLHGTRTILKVKAMPNDLNTIDRNGIQKHEINSFSRSLSSYNINSLINSDIKPSKCSSPHHHHHHHHHSHPHSHSHQHDFHRNDRSNYSNMSSSPYAVRLPITRMDTCGVSNENYCSRPKSESNNCRKHESTSFKSNSNSKCSPTIQLDLEINTPRNDIKISRRCKSYEVRF